MKHVNAVIIEEQVDLFNDLTIKYKCLFGMINYSFVANHAKGQKDAQKIIESKQCGDRIHIVISDIVAGASNSKRGLIWIQRIKKMFPDLLYIGNSGKEVTYRETSVKLPTFDIYIDKQLLNRKASDYLESICEEILNKFKQNTTVCISPDSDIDVEQFKNGNMNRDLCSLISQVLYNGEGVDDSIEPTTVKLSPLSGGYSGSYVFRMDVLCGDQLKAVPSVLKVSLRENAERESRNYKSYVKWILPYQWRVELLNEGYTSKWGAVVYSFISSNNLSFDNVTAFMVKEKRDDIETIVDTIFSPSYRTWYSEKLCKKVEGLQLSEYYSREYFYTDESLINANKYFTELSQKYFNAKIGANCIELPKFDIKIHEPNSVLFTKGRGEFWSTICHGDLNSNNILLAGNKSAVFIDFQNTGRKHVFCDFITFENSLRLYYGIREYQIEEMLRYEGLISELDVIEGRIAEDPEIPHMYNLILKIRREALKNFEKEPFENYLYGTTVFSLRLLRIDDLEDRQYKRVLSQLFSGMTRITT